VSFRIRRRQLDGLQCLHLVQKTLDGSENRWARWLTSRKII
jgi:hypothetical protein